VYSAFPPLPRHREKNPTVPGAGVADAKEDDPLIATPLALEALRDCERAMR
jgi:hypothetical protein